MLTENNRKAVNALNEARTRANLKAEEFVAAFLETGEHAVNPCEVYAIATEQGKAFISALDEAYGGGY